jgi:phage shock protein PspC (stress-responsive transcriptional regulator)
MTKDPFPTPPTPPAPPPPSRPPLRRSSSDRLLAGVAGGLGDYFNVDPVLFRVLFGVTAFFGGAGIIAYLIAWAVIPEHDATNPPLDRLAAELRQRRVPVGLVVAGLIVLGWLGLFSWWAPWQIFPVVIASVVLLAVLSRRERYAPPPVPPAGQAPPPPFSTSDPSTQDLDPTLTPPLWTPPTSGSDRLGWPQTWPETRAWVSESVSARRARIHRAAPVRWLTVGVLAVTLAILGLADWIGGIVIPAYLWTALGIVLAGLVVGALLRRTPWSLTMLLIPIIVGLIGFGGTRASLSDGTGQRVWAPASSSDLAGSYRLAFGQGVLDLRSLPPLAQPRTVTVTMAAGQVRIVAAQNQNVTVHGSLRFGEIRDDANRLGRGGSSGVNIDDVIPAPAGAVGAPLTVNVHLADGNISVAGVG